VKELVYHRHLLPAIERYGSRVGFHDDADDYHATWSEHGERVLRLASAMGGQLGVGRLDRFAVLATNGHGFLELYHAGFLGAGVVNPLNLRLSPLELAFILNDSDSEVVFTDALFAPLVAQVRPQLARLRHVVLMGGGDAPHDVDYEELLASGEVEVPAEPEEDDPAVLMYTGGTTGLPRGVLLSHRAELLNLYHVAITVGLGEDRVFLHQTPMFHAASMAAVLGIPSSGGTSVFVPIFRPDSVMEAVERHRVNQTVMVPTMINMLLEHPDFSPERVSSLRSLVYGASPMPTGLLERIRGVLPDVALSQGYGMTEAASVLTFLTDEDHRRGGDIVASAGRTVPGVTISIRDAEGDEVAIGEEGEVWARAGNLFDCYWKRPEETEEAFRGGWYHTGDVGRLDDDRYLYLVDRVKDMIVTGGENVYSVEVENAISSYPGVEQVAVIGVPDETWGEAVHAVVVPRAGATPTEADIVEHARQRIAAYKVPKSVEFRTDPIPLSGAMKPLKRELREPYWRGQERSVS
jgi:long-chain acyl-CoA synthetase